MTLLEIAKRSLATDARYNAAVEAKSPNAMILRHVSDAWSRAMGLALSLQDVAREAEDLERASGNPAEGAGNPDKPGMTCCEVTKRARERHRPHMGCDGDTRKDRT